MTFEIRKVLNIESSSSFAFVVSNHVSLLTNKLKLLTPIKILADARTPQLTCTYFSVVPTNRANSSRVTWYLIF